MLTDHAGVVPRLRDLSKLSISCLQSILLCDRLLAAAALLTSRPLSRDPSVVLFSCSQTESGTTGQLTFALAYSLFSTLRYGFEESNKTPLLPAQADAKDKEYYSYIPKATVLIAEELEAEGVAMSEREIKAVVNKGAAVYKPRLEEKKPAKKREPVGKTGATPDGKAARTTAAAAASSAAPRARRSASAAPAAAAAAARPAPRAPPPPPSAKPAGRRGSPPSATRTDTAAVNTSADTALARSDEKILTALAELQSASAKGTDSPSVTFSPLKQTITASSAELVARIEKMEDTIVNALLEKNKALSAKVTKLERELAEVNVKYEGEHRLLDEKSSQNTRLQEQLDTVMARFLAKF